MDLRDINSSVPLEQAKAVASDVDACAWIDTSAKIEGEVESGVTFYRSNPMFDTHGRWKGSCTAWLEALQIRKKGSACKQAYKTHRAQTYRCMPTNFKPICVARGSALAIPKQNVMFNIMKSRKTVASNHM